MMKAREVLEKYLDDITSGPGTHTVASLAEGAIYELANAGFVIIPKAEIEQLDRRVAALEIQIGSPIATIPIKRGGTIYPSGNYSGDEPPRHGEKQG